MGVGCATKLKVSPVCDVVRARDHEGGRERCGTVANKVFIWNTSLRKASYIILR